MEREPRSVSATTHGAEVSIGSVPESEIQSQMFALRIRRSILRVAPGRIRELTVDVRRRTIVLHGRCNSYYCKQLAQTVAMELAQGEHVENHIEVA